MKTLTFLLAILLLTLNNNILSQENINKDNCKSGDIVFIKNPAMVNTQLGNEKIKFNCAGVVFLEKGVPMVYYASEPLSKCSLTDFIKLSEDKRFSIKRIVENDLLTEEAINTMHVYATAKLGTPYDTKEELNTEDLYNAEFVWKIYKNCLGIYICEAKDLTASNDKKHDLAHITSNSLAHKFVCIRDLFKSPCFE
jgi:hypothetical protein